MRYPSFFDDVPRIALRATQAIPRRTSSAFDASSAICSSSRMSGG